MFSVPNSIRMKRMLFGTSTSVGSMSTVTSVLDAIRRREVAVAWTVVQQCQVRVSAYSSSYLQ